MSAPADTSAPNRDLAAFVLGLAEEKAAAILAEAQAHAAETERQAYGQARRRLTLIEGQERARAEDQCRLAEARLRARLAARRREVDAQRLERIRVELLAVFEEFWRTPSLAAAWMRTAITRAKAAFPPDGWTVEVAGRAVLPEPLSPLLPEAVKVVRIESARAGLRIRREGAVLDATAEGFLAQGVRVDARLLAALAQAPEAS